MRKTFVKPKVYTLLVGTSKWKPTITMTIFFARSYSHYKSIYSSVNFFSRNFGKQNPTNSLVYPLKKSRQLLVGTRGITELFFRFNWFSSKTKIMVPKKIIAVLDFPSNIRQSNFRLLGLPKRECWRKIERLLNFEWKYRTFEKKFRNYMKIFLANPVIRRLSDTRIFAASTTRTVLRKFWRKVGKLFNCPLLNRRIKETIKSTQNIKRSPFLLIEPWRQRRLWPFLACLLMFRTI